MSHSLPEPRLPDLRFVPVGDLVPHEQHDDQRMRPLAQKLREQGVLKNPPIVAALDPGNPSEPRMVVLDGANRAMAARAAELPHIVAQVVRYDDPDVRLTTWYHALAGYPHARLGDALARIPGLERRPESLHHARAVLARREALAYLVCSDGGVETLHGGEDLGARNDLLNAIVNAYRDASPFYRVTTDSFEAVREAHPDVTALIVFPHFEPDEILELATSGALVPAGITRHLVRCRALRVNIPLERMADRRLSLEEKNRWLDEWLRERLLQRQVRFYEEPTVLFDE
jgi:ParB-like chromosome segregation protein Spo0J